MGMEYRLKSSRFFFSRLFLVFFLLSHIVIYFLGSKVYEFLALNPKMLVYDLEIWRLFTYPFVSLSIAEVILFAFAFWFIGPKVESTFHENYFPIVLVAYIPFQGLIVTGLFAREKFYLVGTEGLSFFILTLYFLIYLRIVNQYEPISIRSMIQTAFIVVFWIMAATVDSFIYQRSTLVNSFAFAMSGILVGLMTYLQVKSFTADMLSRRYQRYQEFKKRLDEFEKLELEEKNIETKVDNLEEQLFSLAGKYIEQYAFTEERLNQILDKMNERGKESLTKEELQFLREYSKRVK